MTLPEPPQGGSGRGPGGRERAYLRYLHLGTQMVVVIILGVFGGMWLDETLGSEPAFVVTGTVLGIVLGMSVIIREVGKERR